MQKTSFFKRIMTLFMVFIMVLGLFRSPVWYPRLMLPRHLRGLPMDSWKIWKGYQSENLVPAYTQPRIFYFDFGGDLGISPGFCGDHKKEIVLEKGEGWNNPVPIEQTPVCHRCSPGSTV